MKSNEEDPTLVQYLHFLLFFIFFYYDKVYGHISVIKQFFLTLQFLPAGLAVEKCLCKIIRAIAVYRFIALSCMFKQWYTWKN